MSERPESWHAALHRLQQAGVAHALATQVTSAGSTPREPGARMVITPDATYDTLGGGTFEWQTIAAARQRLAGGEGRPEPGISLEAFSLGGRSGQCCGGFVNVLIEVFPGSATTLALFGAGHVGTEIVRLADPLGWRLLWHDSRDDAFPDWASSRARLACRPTPDPEAAVAALPAGTHCLVMTHDHAEDRTLIDALLRRGDCASIGLIGSRSKWASFRSRLRDAGHDDAALTRVRCPMGDSGGDKRPYAIALATLAELLPLVADSAPPDQRGLDPAELRALF
ncbi:MAG: xanthine dehydrogenase accessory protein XdhC [Halomonas sp.]|uniref:xanthine dehydrogenase accessory protein XdhC n=1 Tax=Halomonas sp. TaxID=1486246 RepID=UPI00179175C4|nr:xanthine dehydrogenase accessory protein XdhC [Halomonas sp.]NWN82802.1 xanthine dehydrogenase accessory protein XdhC [Halomonas sp.]